MSFFEKSVPIKLKNERVQILELFLAKVTFENDSL